MTLAELAQSLNAIYPTRYSHFTTTQKAPFICYIDDGEENFHADNAVYTEATLINVELYTDAKNLAAERNVKSLFKQREIPYEKGPTIFVESEGLFLTTFSIKLI